MNDLFDVLEICLQELESGSDLETVLARYPDLAAELRPILKASLMARARMTLSAPSPEAIRRGRAKVLQRASEMREGKLAPRRRMIPMFQRLAISFALTALFLTSGTGLVGASSSALPGENLYPVKRTWEGLRLFFTFNTEYRKALENTFENERLHEISELLVEGRNETIQFAGVYMEVNGVAYISGIHIVILDTSVLPLEPLTNGAAVVVTGHTNAQGFVDVESIELLPAGSSVPTGVPVEVDSDHDGNGNGIDNVNDNDNHNENSNDNLNSNGNDNFNENENSNDNTNTNINSNDNGNSNGSDDGGSDDGDSNSLDDGSNSNVNDNGGGDTNTNDDSNTGSNDNSNVNGDDSGGGNGNDNSNSNDSHGGGG